MSVAVHPSARAVPDGMPEPVADALRLLAGDLDAWPPGGAGSRPAELVACLPPSALSTMAAAASGAPLDELAEQWAAEEVLRVQAAERVKAWAEFQQLAALRRLREAAGQSIRDLLDRTDSEIPVEAEAGRVDAATVEEVVAATGLPHGAVASRVAIAQNPDGRSNVLLARLARGEVDFFRVQRICALTQHHDPATANAVAERVLRPMRDGNPVTHRVFTDRLRRELVLADPDWLERQRQEAVAARRVDALLLPEGAGVLTVTGEGERVVAAMERVDALARQLRGKGDDRTLDALRADIALDLLCVGWPQDAAYRDVRPAPPASVHVVVSLTTLLGLDDSAAVVPGHGYLSAAHAREVATAAGSVWRRLVTDPLTGSALELSTHRYRPTRQMSELLRAIDGTCRGPGCTLPAAGCDLDHQIAWPRGQTTVRNINHKHRRHHNLKTWRIWTCTGDDDGTVSWRTLAGRRYTSYPFDYHDVTNRPFTPEQLSAADEADEPPF